MVKRTGDGSLIEFRSVVDAVRCAIEVQNGMVERNAGLPPERLTMRPEHGSDHRHPPIRAFVLLLID
jgi:class 3 adenylate cyclase